MTPPFQDPSRRAHCTLVAKNVMETATLAGESKRKPETAQEENPEELRVEPLTERGGKGTLEKRWPCERSRSHRAGEERGTTV